MFFILLALNIITLIVVYCITERNKKEMTNTENEISKVIEEMKKEQFNKGRKLGYTQGIEDFYNALITTHLTPGEIYEKLKIDD